MRLCTIVSLFLLTFRVFGQNPVPDTSKIESDSLVFHQVEVEAKFPGGMAAMMKFIEKNKKHPKEAKDIEGDVRVIFIVEKDGSISNAKVTKSLHPALDAEAIRVVQLMPNWSPGQQGGKPVKCQFSIPIRFRKP